MDRAKESDLINERIDYKVAEFFCNENPYGVERIILKTYNEKERLIRFLDVNDRDIAPPPDVIKKYSQLWTL